MQPCSEGFAELGELKSLVIANNACALPGVSVRFDEFVSYMWFAVAKGFVRRDHRVAGAPGPCGPMAVTLLPPILHLTEYSPTSIRTV